MRAWALAVMTLLVAFSGCFGGDDDGGETTTTQTATGTATSTQTQTTTTSTGTTTTGTSTGEPEPEENTPPTASISASIEQGQIPFNVTFDLSGADADGDELTWTFDADEDGETDAEGTTLPETYNHTYDAEGLFNATLTVSDGTNETIQTLQINATAAAGGVGPVQEFTGSWVFGDDGTVAFVDTYFCETGPGDGVFYAAFTVEPQSFGKPFHAEITDESGGEAIANWGITFWEVSGCLESESFSSGNIFDGEMGGGAPIDGTIPGPGYTLAYFWSDGGITPSATITIG